MKIAVICYEYPPIGGGGGRAARDVSRRLAELEHEVRVYTSALRFGTGSTAENGVTVRRFFSFRTRAFRCSVPEMAGYLFGAFIPTLQDFRRWRPDVVHCHFAVPSGALAWALHKFTAVPYIITAQLGDVPGAMGDRTQLLFSLLNPFIAPIWRDAADLTACSSFTGKLAEKAYGRKVHTVFNGIDLNENPPEIQPPNTERSFVYVGRFDPQKNLPMLLEALGGLPDELPWRLEMIGDGPERERIREQIRKFNLGDRVHLHGWVAPEEARRRLSDCEVFVMASHQEGLPLAALEALRSGLAVVGSSIGGLADVLIDGRNGLSFQTGDIPSLQVALEKMIRNPSDMLAMRKQSLTLASRFDIRSVTDRYMEILTNAASTHGR